MRQPSSKGHATVPGTTAEAPATTGPELERGGFDRARVIHLDTYISDAKVAQDPTANNPDVGDLRVAN